MTEARITTTFEPARVLLGAALLGALAALAGLLLAGWRAGGGVVLGAAVGAAAFAWLERSLRGEAAGRRAVLLAGSLARMLLWAGAAILVSAAWGPPGGGGFLAGAVAVKAALLAEGIRSRGG